MRVKIGVGVNVGGVVPSGDGFLDSVIGSVNCDLDATIAASFTSGQTWANLIASPSDGDAQTAYDFFLGVDGSASTDDPTFTGSAGDSASYFLMDGGDQFFGQSSGETVITFNNLHKTTASNAWWLVFAFRYIDDGSQQYMMDTRFPGNNHGIAVQIQTDDTIRMWQRTAAANVFSTPGITLVDGTDYLIIITRDEDTDSVDWWVNSTTATTTTANWNAETTDTSGDINVGATDLTAHLANTTRFYTFACGNEFLDDAGAASIFSHLETRHDRDYTPPWDMRNVVFDATFDTSGENTISAGMFLRADGVKMYVVDFSTDNVYQYTLSTPGDPSTATYDSKSFSVASQDTSPQGVWFKSDGTIMYIAGSATGFIYQYTLSTAWDVSTASYASKSLDTSTQSNPRDIFIKPDGTELYTAGPTNASVNQYTLSTPHDVSTGSFTGSFSVNSEETSIVDVYFKDDDGTKMFIIGLTNDTVFQYTLGTAWLASTAVYDGISFSVAAQSTTPQGLVFDATGEALYIVDSTNDVYSYIVG